MITNLIKRNTKESILLFFCLAIFVLMSILSPSRFLTATNLKSMAYQLPEFGILSLAMMVVILTGGINLSMAYTASLSGIATAIVMSSLYAKGISVFVTIILGLLAGLVMNVILGSFNGILVAKLNVSPILATLGTMMLYEGIGLNLTQGRAISGFPSEFDFIGNKALFGIPFGLILFIITVILTWIFFEKNPWGIKVHMIGSNATGMEYSGTNVKRILFSVYLVSAVLSFIAAIIMTSRYNSMKVDYGSSYLMQSILAVVLGGTSIYGGYGKVGGTVLAVLTLQFLSSGLNIFGLNRFFIDIIMGCLLLIVLAISFIFSKIRLGRQPIKK